MTLTVLHLLSQRPSLTGSGVTLDALVRHARDAGWRQAVVVGVPRSEPHPAVGDLAPSSIHPLLFGPGGHGGLDFPVPGMSDVMPYESTRFASLEEGQLAAYRQAWRDHLARVIDRVRPDVIHAHHIWLLSALLRDVAPDTPIVSQCHATGLRQLALCPHLADEVRRGCARNDRFVVLHHEHAAQLAQALGVGRDRIHEVGAGYREELFHPGGRAAPDRAAKQLLYIGKFSEAKGLPWLLDALEHLTPHHADLTLHVAGDGAGDEAEALRRRMEAMAPTVVLHGQLTQPALADLMRRCAVCVLPSLYEGVPLVLVEALACGCRLVATRLPGIVHQLAPHLGDGLDLVDLPRLQTIDTPAPADLPDFVERLRAALDAALHKPPPTVDPRRLAPFTWSALFHRVESVWLTLIKEAKK